MPFTVEHLKSLAQEIIKDPAQFNADHQNGLFLFQSCPNGLANYGSLKTHVEEKLSDNPNAQINLKSTWTQLFQPGEPWTMDDIVQPKTELAPVPFPAAA